MRPLIYIQVYCGYFVAKRIGTSQSVRKESSALAHPRSIITDVKILSADFSSSLREILPRYTPLKPHGLIHLIPEFEGGYTNWELTAFVEAGEAIGIRLKHVSTQNRPHTDAEVIEALQS